MLEIREQPESQLIVHPDHAGISHSSAPLDPNALTSKTLSLWLDEIRNQPHWRLQADKEADYYDGNQLSPEQLEIAEQRGLAPIYTNLVKPVINAVLGLEAKSKRDPIIRPEAGMLSTEAAAAVTVRLHEAAAESRAQRAISDAYGDMMKVGLGWVEVGRCADPFKPPYRVKAVHRREIFWDWRKREPEDWRYLVRKQWLDKDVCMQAFPKQKDFIAHAMNGWANWDYFQAQNPFLARAWDVQRGMGVEQYEWLNTQRQRLAVYETWYRTLVNDFVVRLPSGRAVELDRNDHNMVSAILEGMIQPIPATFHRVRVAFWIGPIMVTDEPSPFKHQHFPYVPFFCFREDRTNVPYGLIRDMLSPQDEVNARRAKLYWHLSARNTIADADAVLDHQKTAEEVSRPDAYIVLNPNRKPSSRFEINAHSQNLPEQQFKILQLAKEEVNQAAGVYQTMMGQQSSGADSGVAIDALMESGMTTLAEPNDNYRQAMKMVYELLADLVVEDLSKMPNHEVEIEDDDGLGKKAIIVNEIVQDPQTGQTTINNDITGAKMSVVLDDTISSPTARRQQLAQLSEVMKALPPQAQAVLMDYYIESTDLPYKKNMANRIRKMLGLDDPSQGDGQDSEKMALQQQIEELQAQLQQAVEAPQMKELAAKIDKLEADAALSRAKAFQIIEQQADIEMAEANPEADDAEEMEAWNKVFQMPFQDELNQAQSAINQPQPGQQNAGQPQPGAV